jgi:hypothetical protein
MWLAITTLLGLLSGWYFLMQKFPNRNEKELLQLKYQSGSMGIGVSMNRILNIGVCPSGLRIGMMRIFGIFCRDFFVPWQELRVTRVKGFLWQPAELRFGDPPIGRLRIPSHIADRLARAALDQWPEAGPFPEETNTQAFASIARQWAAATCFAAMFFIVVPRIASPSANFPISVAILFPAVVFGIAYLIEYYRRTKR